MREGGGGGGGGVSAGHYCTYKFSTYLDKTASKWPLIAPLFSTPHSILVQGEQNGSACPSDHCSTWPIWLL